MPFPFLRSHRTFATPFTLGPQTSDAALAFGNPGHLTTVSGPTTLSVVKSPKAFLQAPPASFDLTGLSM